MIKVTDIAYGRLRAPDLDLMEAFLIDFGMHRAARTKTALYMRGSDADHHIHVTELGEPGCIGFAFHAANAEDLEILSRAEGAGAVEDIDEPGGGKRVCLTDPNGYRIEVIHGQETAEPLAVRRVVYNTGFERLNRTGDLQRLRLEPSHVKRSAHCVFKTTDLAKTLDWYRSHFGLLTTDRIYVGERDNLLAEFLHVDKGADFVDHHVLLALQSDAIGFNHLSFEVSDFDDVAMGHEFLEKTGKYKHAWGIGRHIYGSQIFDYWRDPWGRIHEHWTDTDMVNRDHVPDLVSAEEGLANQWGPDFPDTFLDDPSMHSV